ncbi:hypothetical protein pipiens_004015 [Culex pipiens pipiens]|uniref:Peptidase M12B domain-containing protein n=1 Tax=Culex pipiens pipiens TaxID=38569 RepID=A0ABD1CPR1_CULPP
MFSLQIDEKNLHQFLKEHEKLLLFGENDAAAAEDFTIVSVRRRKRTTRSTERLISFNVSNSAVADFSVELRKSNILIDDSFAFIESYDNSTQLLDDSYQLVQQYADCFYRNDHAAFDLCEGGIQRFGSSSHVLIYRNRTTDSAAPSTNQTDENVIFEPDMAAYEPTFNEPRDRRNKRHISNIKVPDTLHVETAIFIDKDLYRHMSKNFPKNTEAHLIRFVLAMINGVQLLYNHPSLGRPINFILKRLEILHNDPKDLRRSSDIDVYLNSFCGWQRKLNPISDADPVHFDHAVILTGLDLYVVSKTGKVSNQVVGLAPVAGMCTMTSSCTINEGKHFESVFVVSHEIGHK